MLLLVWQKHNLQVTFLEINQVDNFKHTTQRLLGTSLTNDVFALVIQICRDSFGADTEFVLTAEAAREPMCILATIKQLLDMYIYALKKGQDTKS